MIPYNKPQFIDGVVVTKYRKDTTPGEIRRIRTQAKELARKHSSVWYWDWKTRKKIYI